MFRVLILAAVTGAICAQAAFAQSPAEFYKGKTVAIVVGFSPGGGYDQYGRLLARRFGEHIPGKPLVVVQNAPGAGSLTAVRRLDGSLPRDGTVVVTFNPALITETILEPEKLKFRFTDVDFIGSITRDFRVCFMWHTTGAKTWGDVLKRQEVIFGATSKGVGAYVNQAILKNVFGVKARQILGFPGSAEQRIAIERGELDGDCGSWSSVPEEWIRDKKAFPFVMFSPFKTPDMPADIPYIGTFAQNAEQKGVLDILSAAGELGRPYVVSRSIPADRLESLRKAFDATVRDPEFLADARKQQLPVYPINGTDARRIVAQIYASPSDLVAKAKAAAE